MSSLRETFATAVRRHRENLGISQEELALRASMDRTGISRLERTAPNISLDSADTVSAALETCFVTLLGGNIEAGPARMAARTVFATRVQEERLARGFSQRQLGDLARVDRNYVSAIESGKENPRLDTVEKFARALKLPVVALLTSV